MEDQNKVYSRLLRIIQEYQGSQAQGSFLEYHPPEELRGILGLDGGVPGDWDYIFDWLEKYLAYSVKTSHPGFVNRMWVGGNQPSVLGEMVTALTNTSACTYEAAPVATLIEKYMIRQMLDLVGFVSGEGQMTTGSSNANMIAMLAARNTSATGVKKGGLFSQSAMCAFVSAEAHYSMDKAANILGVGTDHLVKIPVDQRGRMDVAILGENIAQVVAGGGLPFFVGATAGTTVRGAYDQLDPLLALKNKYNFWLHVDGAWGGAAVLSATLRAKFLAGLEKVDSFTWDFHKMLGAALMCNILLINNRPGTLGAACGAGDVSYIFRAGADNEVCDLGSLSLQCGRRVDSLKWFLDWKFYGAKGLAERVEGFLGLCEYAEGVVRQTGELEMVVDRESFNVCFRYKAPDHVINDCNRKLRQRLYEQGAALVGTAYIGKKLTLRLLLTNPEFGRGEVDDFFDKVVETGRIIMEEQN